MNISGNWYNELGSILSIGNVTGNRFDLSYETAVSASKCAKGSFSGTGYLNVSEAGTNIGFVVSWQNQLSNCQSVTSWCGYLIGDFAEPEIVAFWLLTSADSESSWANTLVGQDIFTRYIPSEESVSKSLITKRHAHI